MNSLILNDITRTELRAYLDHPVHALMLTGPAGVGLGTIAKSLARQIAGSDIVLLEPALHKQQKTAIISAEDVKDLSELTRDKLDHKLMIVIDGADQAASGVFERLLKLIEEPVPGVGYIFTAHNLAAIPKTIMSRSAVIRVRVPSAEQCQTLYEGLDQRKATQIKYLAECLPAAIMRLKNDDEYLAKRGESVEKAKNFLMSKAAKRLEVVADLDRGQALLLTEDLKKLVIMLSKQARAKEAIAIRLQNLEACTNRLKANCNVRAQLLDLALNFDAAPHMV